ncbi:MAG: Bax inhibitor-1/YccA family protein [Paracoccus sp. (in: a-proteobacteria)]|nr:Bax inhibitor-1/YccA family protein [Paracoccus sp. (in: a-proteobacteria)]
MAEFDSLRQAHARAGAASQARIDEGLRAYMNRVYGIMSVGMLVTAAAAWAISGLAVTEVNGQQQLTELGRMIYTTPLRWVIMFAPLIIVFGFGAMINRMSTATATTVFYAFAALMGVSISWIFLQFTGMSIIQTFLITAAAFAGLSLYGYTTKRDLSPIGTFLIMGLIGLIIAMIVNLFVQSGTMQMAISVLGVLIFAGLTAFDTQRIKNEYVAMAASGSDFVGKAAIMGALTLYLNFLNLFMFLLQFLGNRE